MMRAHARTEIFLVYGNNEPSAVVIYFLFVFT